MTSSSSVDILALLDRLEAALPPSKSVELIAAVQCALDSAANQPSNHRPDGIADLATGLAHDLNNLFFAIRGSAELIEASISPSSPIRPYVDIIESVSVRASELSEELLLFAGEELREGQQLSLNTAIEQFLEHAQSVEGVRLKKELGCGDLRLWIDPSLLRRVLLGLVVNAEAARVDVDSKILIRTGACELGATDLSQLDFSANLRAARFVWLEVEDHGCGMTEDVRTQVFNPYFSALSDGRGMGLFVVQGIVRAAGGAGGIYSTPGEGTRLRLYFPEWSGEEEEEEVITGTLNTFRAEALVLVVDDEPEVNTVVTEMLELMGYEVCSFTSAHEALAAFDELSDRVDIALLDYKMPEMDGAHLLRALRAIRPDLPAVLTSGYLAPHAARDKEQWSGFLKKPYSMNELLVTLRRVVGRVKQS